MNKDSFIDLTTATFENIAIQFNLIRHIGNQNVVYRSETYQLSIYYDNFFEINVSFDFYFDMTRLSLHLEDLATYLRFDEHTIECIRHNQITNEEYYKSYISEISEVCKRIISIIHLDNDIVSSCYCWKEQRHKILNEDYNVMHIESMLNELWREKNYKTYLECYFENLALIKKSHIKLLLEKRANYAKSKQLHQSGDGSVIDNSFSD